MLTKLAIVLGSLGSALIIAGKIASGALDPMTGVSLLFAAISPIGSMLHISKAVSDHEEEHHPDQNPPGSSDAAPGFGERMKAQGGYTHLQAVELLAALALVGALAVAGCAAIIPRTHVEADLARHRTISAEWRRYYHTGFGADGHPLAPSFIAACDANYAAEERDVLEELKAAGMLPASATSTAQYVEN